MTVRRYLAYLRYVMRHRREVRKACWRVGLYWRGLIHDLSKYSPSEFGPYARQFYEPDGTKKPSVRDKTGAYDPNAQPEEFRLAWAHHYTHNDRHWEYWSLGDISEEMPAASVVEMMCD